MRLALCLLAALIAVAAARDAARLAIREARAGHLAESAGAVAWSVVLTAAAVLAWLTGQPA